jgi:hypothetical protein
MGGSDRGGIFISYRREETAPYAGRLYDRLSDHFGDGKVFMDVDSISLGLDFTKAITDAVASSDVLIALIGARWLDITDGEGRRRIDDEQDFVRLEIKAALQRDIRVIPILVDGAQLPRGEQLPQDLQGLARRQALKITHEYFRSVADRLVADLDRLYPQARSKKEPAKLKLPDRHSRS